MPSFDDAGKLNGIVHLPFRLKDTLKFIHQRLSTVVTVDARGAKNWLGLFDRQLVGLCDRPFKNTWGQWLNSDAHFLSFTAFTAMSNKDTGAMQALKCSSIGPPSMQEFVG